VSLFATHAIRECSPGWASKEVKIDDKFFCDLTPHVTGAVENGVGLGKADILSLPLGVFCHPSHFTKRGAPLSSLTQDGMDGMLGISGKSLQENLTFEEPPKSPTSCPTCPPNNIAKERVDA
jgi:hypothetical protein